MKRRLHEYGLRVLDFEFIQGREILEGLKLNKARRYPFDGEVEGYIYTSQGILHFRSEQGFECDMRSGPKLVDWYVPNLGSIEERIAWLTHDLNGYGLDLCFEDTNLLLFAILRDLAGYHYPKAKLVQLAVSISRSWYGEPKPGEWCAKNIGKVTTKWESKKMASIFLTLDGKLSAKHPVHDIICREDGAVFSNGRWTFGGKYTKRYLGIGYKNKSYYIHRLIAEAFLPNQLKKYSVDHINRNSTDNSLVNLRWATQKEQLENSSKVLGRFDCGVRKCDDANAWRRVRYHIFIEKEHERSRIKHLKKKFIQTISMLFILKNRFCLE